MEIEEKSQNSDIEEELRRVEQFFCQNDQSQEQQQQIIVDEDEALNLIEYNLNDSLYQQTEELNFYQTIKEFTNFTQKDIKSKHSSINLMSIEDFQEECKQEEKKGFQKVVSNLKNNLTKILMKNQLAFLHFLIVFIRLKKLVNVCLYFKNILINYSKQTQWILFLDFQESKIVFDLFRSQINSLQNSNQIFFFSSVQNYPTNQQVDVIEFYYKKKFSWKNQIKAFKFLKFDLSNTIFDILSNLNSIENILTIQQNILEDKIVKKILIDMNTFDGYQKIWESCKDLDYQQREVKYLNIFEKKQINSV